MNAESQPLKKKKIKCYDKSLKIWFKRCVEMAFYCILRILIFFILQMSRHNVSSKHQQTVKTRVTIRLSKRIFIVNLL